MQKLIKPAKKSKRHIIKDIIIRPRIPKWERQNLIKKEAEEYIAICKSERHPLVKKYHKTHHFLKWAIKLLVPDFLIGHPNLWDNLKVLRKHPQFKPLRMALAAWVVFLFTVGGVGIYSLINAPKSEAATFANGTQAEFDAGTYADTQWNTTNNWVDLTATGETNNSGIYTSAIKDAGGSAIWNSIAWTPESPTGKELPDNAASETAYSSGNANMSGNVLLMHMNETSGAIVDSSGNGNNGTVVGGVTYGVPGKLNTAIGLNGSSGYINIPNSTSLNFGTGNFSFSMWAKTTASSFANAQMLISKRKNAVGEAGFYSYIDTSGNWSANLFNTSAAISNNDGGTLSLNKWYFFTVVYDRNGNMTRYLDGVQHGTATNIASFSGSIDNTYSLSIGKLTYPDSLYFHGDIDEVTIYNRALSATEIANLYKRGTLKLKYQVRSCSDATCSVKAFIGPNGTASSYYEWGATNPITTPSFALTNVPNNRYFQYKAYFETDDSTLSPELKSVTTDYTLNNLPPNIPINETPANGVTAQNLLNITLTGSTYSDPENDPQTDTDWRVDNNSDFSSPVWTRTAGVAEATTTIATSTGTFANELAGKIELNHNTTYYWQVRYFDGTSWSGWSTSTSFTTNIIHTPTNLTPLNNATLLTLTPLLTASAFSDGESGHTHAATQWQVDDNSNFSSPAYDSGTTVSGEVSRAVPSGLLSNFSTYYWRVRYQDSLGMWSNWSTSAQFSINIPSTAVGVIPIFGNTTVNQGDNIKIDVQVKNFADGSPLNNVTSTISIYDSSGTKIVNGVAMTYVAGSNGIYRYSYIVPSTSGSYLYEVKAISGSNSGYGAGNFEVGTIATDVSSTKAVVTSEQTAQTTERALQAIERAAQSTERSAQSAERTAQTSSRIEVTKIKNQVKAGILDSPKTAKSGDTITIKYQAQSGLTGTGAPKLNVYDANNVQRVTDAAMTEIGSTGVYSASTILQSGWGTGFFTVEVSENTNNTSDHTQIFVGSSDVQSIGSDVSSIKSNVSSIKSTVESTANNVDILIGAMIVTQSTVNDTSASTTVFITNLTNSTNNFYKNAVLTFTSGALNGQSRRISAYNSVTKIITLDPALTSAPANGDAFTIIKQNVRVQEQVASHENLQAAERSTQATFRSNTTAKLATIEGKIDTITTTLDTVNTNLDSVLSTVNFIRASQQKQYKVNFSDVSEIQAGNTYRAKLTILDADDNPVDASTTPTVLVYDATRVIAQATVAMTKISTGVYEYSSTISPSATAGLWESIVNVNVGGTSDIVRNDYFQVTGAPAQVIIRSITDTSIPSISAGVTITNEGGSAYEYHYEWCVVSSQENQCGGNNDVYYASAAKLIAAGDSFNPTLTATVPTAGNYWFKVVVYYGTKASGASRTFTTVANTGGTTFSGGSSGGAAGTIVGGAGGSVSGVVSNTTVGSVGVGNSSIQKSTNENIYSEIVKTRQDLDLNSQKLSHVLAILGIVDPAMQRLLSVNTLNTKNLKDVQNKVADLKAVSSATRQIIKQKNIRPIVETYMKFNSVEINFLVTNPSDTRQTVKFKAFLPKEAKPEYIINSNGLKVDYDTNAAVYVVSGNITLGPKETVTRKVEMKDIWVFSSEKINALKSRAKGLLSALKQTQYFAQGVVLKNGIDSMLDVVSLRQKGSYSSPQEHIVVYRENEGRVARAENDLEKLNDLVVQTGASQGVVGKIGGIQTFSTWGIILAIVFGFGLLAAVIFAMWRHQTMLAVMAMGMSKQEIAAYFGGVKKRQHKIVKKNEGRKASLSQKLFTRRLSWKEILMCSAAIGVVIILGIMVTKVAPGLFGSQEVKIENKKVSAVMLVAPKENLIGAQLVPGRQGTIKVLSNDGKGKKEDKMALQSIPPKLKIMDTPTGWLNVRSDAALNGEVITKVNPGEEYKYIDEKNGWYQIMLNDGKLGWIFGQFAKVLNK